MTWPKEYKPLHFGEHHWPKVSVIVPSYNQGAFIENTLLSIFHQQYPNLELIIIDGGSTDETLEIIRKYESKIAYWVSEPDGGQSDAINKGLKCATGDWLAFMNSDDGYWEGALNTVFSGNLDGIDFIYGNTGYVGPSFDENKLISARKINPLKVQSLMRFFVSVDYIIPSQSVFFSRKLFEEVGYFDTDLHMCMDLDYYIRVALMKPGYVAVEEPVFFYRLGEHTKTGSQSTKMFDEAVEVARRYTSALCEAEKRELLKEMNYTRAYKKLSLDNIKWQHIWSAFSASPKLALSDRRFLGYCKRKVLGVN